MFWKLDELTRISNSEICAGRSSERPVLSEEQINENVAGIQSSLERLLQPEVERENQASFVNNLVGHQTAENCITKLIGHDARFVPRGGL